MTHFNFILPHQAIVKKTWILFIIPLYRGKTGLRRTYCRTNWENPTWREANVSLIETVNFMDLWGRFFSPMLRDVHPVKTACICPWKQLQESVGHAGCCVDTCSVAQMWPEFQPAGVLVELDFTLSLCLFGLYIVSPVQCRRRIIFYHHHYYFIFFPVCFFFFPFF